MTTTNTELGRVVQINRKPQTTGEPGLPKHPVPRAFVRVAGVEGDFNVYRHDKKADTPHRALLLYPLAKIEELNAEGWPLRPGDIGENLTFDGIDYDAMQPTTEWRIGTTLRIRITEACHPCKTLGNLSYVGRERTRSFIATMNGRRGWYAKVLVEGEVRVGDAIRRG